MQTLHLFVTKTCHAACPLCCNRGYNIDEIPVVKPQELKNSDMICITGGDPTLNLNNLDTLIKNIRREQERYARKTKQKIIVYTTGEGLYDYLDKYQHYLCDGFSIGPKNFYHWKEFDRILSGISADRFQWKSMRIYVFPEWEQTFAAIKNNHHFILEKFEIIHRKWQENFKPAKNSIFRRLPILY